VLSIRHANERIQRGGFNPRLLNGENLEDKMNNYLLVFPEGFENFEGFFSKNCLLLSLVVGYHLVAFLNGETSKYKMLRDFNVKNKSKPDLNSSGKALLMETAKICKSTKILFEGPHSLFDIAPKFFQKFKCQIIVFNNLMKDQISYIFPEIYDDTLPSIFLLQEIFKERSHIFLITKIKSFQRKNFSICFYCEKTYKSKTFIFKLHKCKKRKTCESCWRYTFFPNTYLNKDNTHLYCVENKEFQKKCQKCEVFFKNELCQKFHDCKSFFCIICQKNISKSLFKSIEESIKDHICNKSFCFTCKYFFPTNKVHNCRLRKSEIDKNQPALGFFNFQIANSSDASCFECFGNKDLLRKSKNMDWNEFLTLEKKDKNLKEEYLCLHHQNYNEEDIFVNLATLKLEDKQRGLFQTMVFYEDEMYDLYDESFAPEKKNYCNIEISKSALLKRFGKASNASEIFKENVENLRKSKKKSTLEKMLIALFDFYNTTLICFGSENLHFIYKCLVDNGIDCKPLFNGQNILMIEIEFFALRFINLENYFKVQLNDLIDLFQLECKMIYFPEILNSPRNYNLITLMQDFPLEFYLKFNDSPKEKERKRKYQSQLSSDVQEWHFQKKLLEYSLFQLNVIFLASLKFVINSLDLQKNLVTKLTLPFSRNYCTISSFIYNLFKKVFIDPGKKLYIVKNEYPKKIQSSKEEMEFAAYLEYLFPDKKFNNVFSQKNERKFQRAEADVLCLDENSIYFFNGCVCHGHDPKICPISVKKKNPTYFGKSFEQLRKEFDEKMDFLSENFPHFKRNIIWQCEWRRKKKEEQRLLEFLKTYIPWPSHHISPREAVRGAKIEAYALRWRSSENLDEKMYYIDCSSLYPYMGYVFKIIIIKKILECRESNHKKETYLTIMRRFYHKAKYDFLIK